MVDGFAEVEVVVECAILLFVVFDLGADESARLAIDFAGSLPQVGAFAELLGQDVAGAKSAQAASATPLSVLTKSAARASRFSQALSPARISSASGPRPCSRARVASDCFFGR